MDGYHEGNALFRRYVQRLGDQCKVQRAGRREGAAAVGRRGAWRRVPRGHRLAVRDGGGQLGEFPVVVSIRNSQVWF